MQKVTGIWIDKRVAKILTIDNGSEYFQTLNSSIEEYRPKGGSGTRLKGGPQDVIQDSRYTEREKQQQKLFFKNIMDTIADSDQLVIFGPAEMGEKLYSQLSESAPTIHKKIREVKTTDSMTDNQVQAWIRNYFKQ